MAKNYKVNTGSKPSIPDGTVVSVIFRDGSTSFGEVEYWNFSFEDVPKDILYYKQTTKQNCIRNYTPNKGSYPIPEGTLVDVIHRDGEVYKKQDAVKGCNCRDWSISKDQEYIGDIIFWRLSKPKKEKVA